MASVHPSPTPNPDAMKFGLDVTLPAPFNVTSADDAAEHPFARAVFEGGGVEAVFGVNDFVTVTRRPGADWDGIVERVRAAAHEHL